MMVSEARKITFQEVWDSTTIFFVDEDLEASIDVEVESLLKAAKDDRVLEDSVVDINSITSFLLENELALDIILRDIELSEEKFMRMVSLLRKIGRIPGGFSTTDTEWGIGKIKRKIHQDTAFARLIAGLLVEGKSDQNLAKYIPRYYLDTLNYREIKGSSHAARRIRYKRSLIGTYGGRKGYKVENRIHQKLNDVQNRYGIPFNQGRSRLIETDLDFAVPGVDDPWVIIMSSFQETTSSGQTTKTRDMLSAYERVIRNNSRYGENRVFINFVDGGGWLARKRDLERLVNQCHYFINLTYIDMIEGIILKHVPSKYFERNE